MLLTTAIGEGKAAQGAAMAFVKFARSAEEAKSSTMLAELVESAWCFWCRSSSETQIYALQALQPFVGKYLGVSQSISLINAVGQLSEKGDGWLSQKVMNLLDLFSFSQVSKSDRCNALRAAMESLAVVPQKEVPRLLNLVGQLQHLKQQDNIGWEFL